MRDERPGEAAAIAALVTAAFDGAPHAGGNEAAIVNDLRASGALAVSLVAVVDDAIVGHVAASPVTIYGADGWYGIGPLSTRAGNRRRGIGATLMRAALAQLEAMGARGAVLLGDPAYYARFGFAADPALTWRDAPSRYVQGLAFGDCASPRGEIAYHPAFG